MPPLCFVTGATGFVGRHLVPLLAREYRLRVLVRSGRALPFAADLVGERIEGDLDDREALARGVDGACLVVHLAAMVSFRRQDRAAMQRINVDATAALAALARAASVSRLLHVSTISAIGYSARPEVLDETAPFNYGPLRVGYCDTKHAAESVVLAEVGRGLDAVIVNPPSMFGAGDRRKGDDSLLTAVIDGRLRLAPPGGLNVANVDDVCAGILAAIARGRSGERYILGGDNLTGSELTARIAAVVGATAPRRALPTWLVRIAATLLGAKERVLGSRPPVTSDILRLAPLFHWYSSAKAERELGYVRGPVDAGIAAAVAELPGRGPGIRGCV
ncbi:MAG: NAD-dependent epimerase/dehydratase family protein [Planctomycetes bacterium]|nr:NAD-dependent epimerase/dehydratase family protein [Planctomycetota bacterium]